MKQKFATTKTVLISLLLVLAICCLAVTVALNYSEQVAKAEGQVVAAGQPVTSVDELPQDSSSGNGTMPIANEGTAGNFAQFNSYWTNTSYDKITLSGTVTLTANLTLARSMTIELNNNNLVMGNYTITINNGGSLIIQDTASSKTSRQVSAFALGSESRSNISITGGVVVGGNAHVITLNSGGKFELKSGTIAGANMTYGAVYLDGGTFTMSGGAISYNRTTTGSAAVTISSGTFTFTNGTISNNTSSVGGGVNMIGGTFTMNGSSAKITNNNANFGGGVYANNDSKFTLTNGTISSNKAVDTNGGGVYAYSGTFTMNGGTISGNSSVQSGAGIVVGPEATVTMSAGTVSGNTATRYGGGVHVIGGKFEMKGGTISGNTATLNGNNVYFGTANSKLALSGTAKCDIMLGANIILDAASSIGGTVTIDLNNCNLTIGTNTITVANSGSLTIQDTANSKTSRQVSAFALGSESRSNIDITGGVLVGGDAHVITVKSGGKFELKSGTIAGANTNSGSVCVDGGTFTMSGGAVSYNKAPADTAGVYLTNDGTFTFTNGTISNNTSRVGGGVDLVSGTFTMNGSSAIITNNSARFGGGVYVNGDCKFTLSNGTISGNKTTETNGGGVYVYCGTFEMKGGTISGNTALQAGGGVMLGADATFTMSAGTISGNKASTTGGGVHVNGGSFTMSGTSAKINGSNTATYGGGVYMAVASKFTMSAGTISGNTATTNGAGVYLGNVNNKVAISGTATCDIMLGANITVDEEFSIGGTVTIDLNNYNLILDGNTITVANKGSLTIQDTAAKKTDRKVKAFALGATERSDITINGGAVVGGDAHVVTVKSGGKFELKDGTIAGANTRSGSVYVDGGTFTMSGGAVSYNRAPADTAGVYLTNNATFTFTDGTISNNTSSVGGGVDMISGTFTMNGSSATITNNSARFGGGVYVNGDCKFTLSNGTISGNKTTETNGGGVYVYCGTFEMKGGTISGNTALQAGGGVMLAEEATFIMSAGTISGNKASTNGGGVYVNGGSFTMSGASAKINGTNTATYGGGVYVAVAGKFTMSAGTISGNTATTNGAGVYLGNVNNKVAISGTATCDITLGANITVDEEISIGGTVKIDLNNYNLDVAACSIVVNDKGSLTIQDLATKKTDRKVTAFALGATDSSDVTINGGVVIGGANHAITLNAGGTFELKSGTIAGSYAMFGAVYVDGGTFTMSGGAISYNKSSSGSAAVHINSGTFTFTNGTISNNTSSVGGGVNIVDGTFTMNGSSAIITNNSAKFGGGIYANGDCKFTLINGTISGNKTTDTNGGGVYVYRGTFEMKGGTISGNTAVQSGGGVILGADATFTMSAGTISGNKASTNGGGVHVNGGTFIMNGTSAKINGTNTAVIGGGVYVYGTFTMSAGTISGNTATTNGGGVYVAKDATFNLSGTPVIKDNKKGTANSNIYLPSGAFIKIPAAITSAANSIGITADSDRVITNSGTVASTNGFFTDVSTKCLGISSGDMKIATHSVTTWNYNTEKHWRECANCGVTANEAAHGWTWSANGEQHTAKCSSSCGVDNKTHEATNPNEWTGSNATGHSGKCAGDGCTLTITRDHSYGDSWDQEKDYHSQTCTAAGCEYKKTEAHFIEVDYEDVGDGVHHRGVCVTCQMRDAQAEHTPDLSTKPQGDQYSHWFECTTCKGAAKISHDWTSKPYATDDSGKHWQYCAECEYKYNETTHIKSETKQVDATCQNPGTRAYYTCLICEFNFEDDSLTTKIEDLNNWLTNGGGVIPKNESAHVWSDWQCDTVRGEHYKECTVCYERTGTAIHTMQKMEGTPATCTDNGTKDYYYCRVCRSAFEDKDGSKVIGNEDALDDWLTNGKGKIEAGHKWNENGICTVCGDYSKWLEDMRGLVEELEDPEKSELEKKLDEVDPSKPGYVPPEDPEQTLGEIEQEIKGALEDQNPGLAEEKEQAIEQLNDEASKKNKEIADDSNLSDEQKKELQDQVNKELEKAKRNVELATDSDGVQEALEQGKEAINGIEADDVKPEDGHTHKWSDEWSFDEHGHWHACESCDEHKDYAPHALTRESGNITSNGSESHSGECVCGTTVTEKHVADGSSYQDNHDLSGHWHVCEICDAHIDVISHDWNGSWTASKDNHYQECKECGQRYEQDHDLMDMPQQDAQCEFFGDGVPGVKAYSVCETCGMYFDEEGNEIGNRQAFESWTKNKGKIDPEHSFDKNGVCTKCGDYSKALEDMRKKLEQLPEGPEKEELEEELNKLDPKDPSYEEDDVPDDIDVALEDINGKINDAINGNNEGLKEAKDAAKEEIQNKAEEERNKVDKDDTLSDEAKAAKKAEIDKEEQKILDEIDNATSSGEVDEKKEAGLESLGKAADRYVPDESHTHSWSDTPSSDATGHWYACEECGERKGYEKHVLTSSSENIKANGNETHTGECTVCGRSVTQSHVSNGSTYQDNHDVSGHWLVCAVCSAQFKKVEHEWSEDDWQVADGYHYQECEVCKEVYKQDHSMTNWTTTGSTEHTRSCEICSKEETKTHVWGETYYDDGKGSHYQVCADCGYETEHTQHSVSSWTSKNSEIHQGLCSECQLTVMAEHDWETETRSYDNNGHWFKCKSTDCAARNDYQIHSVTSWENAQDNANHKGQCECGKEITQAHVLGELKKEAEGNKYYQECTVDGCDYETEHKDLGDVHVHTWKWNHDDFSHWQECTDPDCAARKDEKAHTFGEWSVEGGKHEHTCSKAECNFTLSEEHKLVAHKGIEASCTQFGQQPYWFCSTCEKNFKDADGKQLIEKEIEEWLDTVGEGKIDKISHSYDGDWMSNAEGHWKVCSVCGNKQSAPASHVYGSWTNANNGQHYKECETCLYKTYEAHSYSASWQGADGYHFQKCDNCDHVEQQTHNNGLASNRTAQVNPTEDTPGVKAYSKCSICNIYFDDNGNKIGGEQELTNWKNGLGRIEPSTSDSHEHSFTKKNQHDDVSHWDECECGARQNVIAHQVSEWTMQNATTHTGECTVCGATVIQAHKLNNNNECESCDYVLTNTPDCNHVVTSGTSNGNETHSGVCEICGLTVSVAHVWSEEYVTDERGHWYECTVCGDRKDYAEHHVTEWTSDGEHTHTGICEVCGEVITHDHSWLFGFCTECPDQLKNYSEADIGIAATAIVAQLFALIAVAAIISRRMKR